MDNTTNRDVPLTACVVVPMGIADAGEENSIEAQQLSLQQQQEQEPPQVTRTIVHRDFTSIEELMQYINSKPKHCAV